MHNNIIIAQAKPSHPWSWAWRIKVRLTVLDFQQWLMHSGKVLATDRLACWQSKYKGWHHSKLGSIRPFASTCPTRWSWPRQKNFKNACTKKFIVWKIDYIQTCSLLLWLQWRLYLQEFGQLEGWIVKLENDDRRYMVIILRFKWGFSSTYHYKY